MRVSSNGRRRVTGTKRRRVYAGEDVGGEVQVAPEAESLLFEPEDVAELVAEVTGEPVEVTSEDTTATFAVGEDTYTVEADGTEEVLESTRIPAKRRRVAASTQSRRRTVRKYPSAYRRR